MLIHLCSVCEKISINRIARDDPEHKVLGIFRQSFDLEDKVRQRLNKVGIDLLEQADEEEIKAQLFGKL